MNIGYKRLTHKQSSKINQYYICLKCYINYRMFLSLLIKQWLKKKRLDKYQDKKVSVSEQTFQIACDVAETA